MNIGPQSILDSPRRVLALVACVALGIGCTAGCGPESLESAERFLVYDRNSDTGEYVAAERNIESLDDISTIRGEHFNLRGGGSIRVGSQAGNRDERTEEQVRNSMKIANHDTPTPDYDIRSDGLVVPWDFHSTMMFTVYHHFEVARDYFLERGVDPSHLNKVPVYYNVRQQFLVPVDLLTDNAAYAFTLDAFLIPPTLLIKDVPLAANRGVIVHEYAHLVFNRLVHGNKRAPAYIVEPWGPAGTNHLASINEGIADIFAALQTGDPNFIKASLSDELFDIDRDLSVQRSYEEGLRQNARNTDPQEYNPYELGTVIASTVWTQTDHMDNDRLAKAVLDTLRALSDVGEDRFRTRLFFDTLVEQLPQERREDACRKFSLRLTAIELECADTYLSSGSER